MIGAEPRKVVWKERDSPLHEHSLMVGLKGLTAQEELQATGAEKRLLV